MTQTNTSFDSLKQIDAGVLNVGYAEAGPTNGPLVMLLHGWPYDIHSYVDVAPVLASAGYWVLVPLEGPIITVPTITIASDFDGAAADGGPYAKKFSGNYSHRIFKGIGHNVPQEAPQDFAKAIVDVDGY
jgi:pimeloyl-ACP methyl ester carboxylesterase